MFFSSKKSKKDNKDKKKKSGFKYYFVLLSTLFILLLISNYRDEILKIFYPLNYSAYVYENSQKYDLDPYLVFAIIKTESNFNKDAQSGKGAKGLMQITDTTGDWIASQLNIENHSSTDLFDPEYNIKMGCWYLNNLITQFDGDISLAIVSYNAGRGNVQKWLGNEEYSSDGKKLDKIPFGETDRYILKVKKDYSIYKNLYHK